MTRLTPRQRAANAFDIIDRHHNECALVAGQGVTHDLPAYAQALDDLARALDAEYGPMPAETPINARGGRRGMGLR